MRAGHRLNGGWWWWWRRKGTWSRMHGMPMHLWDKRVPRVGWGGDGDGRCAAAGGGLHRAWSAPGGEAWQAWSSRGPMGVLCFSFPFLSSLFPSCPLRSLSLTHSLPMPLGPSFPMLLRVHGGWLAPSLLLPPPRRRLPDVSARHGAVDAQGGRHGQPRRPASRQRKRQGAQPKGREESGMLRVSQGQGRGAGGRGGGEGEGRGWGGGAGSARRSRRGRGVASPPKACAAAGPSRHSRVHHARKHVAWAGALHHAHHGRQQPLPILLLLGMVPLCLGGALLLGGVALCVCIGGGGRGGEWREGKDGAAAAVMQPPGKMLSVAGTLPWCFRWGCPACCVGSGCWGE